MFLDYLNFYIIVPVAIILFCALQGFFGNFVRKFMQFIYNPTVLEYLVIVLVICLVLYFMTDVAYGAGSDDLTNLNKPEVNVKDTNVKDVTLLEIVDKLTLGAREIVVCSF